MNDLIEFQYQYDKNNRPLISGLMLHQALGIKTPYRKWFPRVCEGRYVVGEDYVTSDIFVRRLDGTVMPNPLHDHWITIDMAKEICMIQRTDIGKKCREYFLELERRWNSPEAIIARALQFTNRQLAQAKEENKRLLETNADQTRKIAELTPKASYYDVVLACRDLLPISQISKDYGWSARKMNEWLSGQGVQYKQGKVWLLYQKYAGRGFTNTRTHVHPGGDGSPHTTVHTYWTQTGRLFIYELMKKNGILPLMERS